MWRGNELYVRILDPKSGLLLREHVRQKRGWYRIKNEDRPQQMPFQVSQLLWRAGRAGSHIGTLCNLIYGQLGEPGIRRVLGLLSLAKKFGTAAVLTPRQDYWAGELNALQILLSPVTFRGALARDFKPTGWWPCCHHGCI